MIATYPTQLEAAAAPALSWVRSAFFQCAANDSPANARSRQESPRVTIVDHALRADVAAASGGDGDAYLRIIHRYQDLLARRLLRFSRDPRVVEELVHDTFVAAYFSLPRYRGDAPLEHFLQRIATRVGYRHWKRRRREPLAASTAALEGTIPDPRSATKTAAFDAQEEVTLLLEQLPPRDRLVLTLLYIESRTVAEAADLAGWSQSMVKVQAHRARKKFRQLLEASPYRDAFQGESHG
jgi:RNA polymerase sigma-70 factor (ECF subfamily)